MKMRFLSAVTTAFLLFAGPAFADSCPSKDVAQQAASALQSAAKQRSPDALVNAASRYMDIKALSLVALGSYRSKLSPDQTARYLVAARKFVGKFLADHADQIPTAGVSTVTCSGSMATVRFDSGTGITFRMAGPSKVSDVLIIGISVQSAMRNYFTGIIAQHNGDVNALIAAISQ